MTEANLPDDIHALLRTDVPALLETIERTYGPRVELPRPVRYALQLWLAGVRPADAGEWAAWLHLAAVARGDDEVVAEVEGASVSRPWCVRWHHWRPPGAVLTVDPLPGHLMELRLLPKEWAADGRPTVLGHDGHRNRAHQWVWDAETGDLLAGPHRGDAPPTPGESQPMSMARSNALLGWPAYEPSSADRPLVTAHLPVPELDLTLYAAPGGIFAVRSATGDPDPLGPACHAPSRPTADGFPVYVAPDDGGPLMERDPTYPSFVPSDFHRLRAEDLPEDVGHNASLEALLTVGVPSVRAGDLTLEPPRCFAGESVAIAIGMLQYGRLVVEGATGVVYRLPSEFDPPPADEIDALSLEPFHPDEDPTDPARTRPDFDLVALYEALDDDVDAGLALDLDLDEYVAWIAPDLPTFLTMASRYCGVLANLGSLNSEFEARAIIDTIEPTLDEVARTPMDSWWTASLRDSV